jgi:hypothetical protein
MTLTYPLNIEYPFSRGVYPLNTVLVGAYPLNTVLVGEYPLFSRCVSTVYCEYAVFTEYLFRRPRFPAYRYTYTQVTL